LLGHARRLDAELSRRVKQAAEAARPVDLIALTFG
jgi:hypothetical protein